mmetsp:Transcript_30163/g.115705  ORF Transcript_30163/g.115705 Transcript_30163/m.115705 type:complete len:112 (+) Transcript_30163:2183-2518(+)
MDCVPAFDISESAGSQSIPSFTSGKAFENMDLQIRGTPENFIQHQSMGRIESGVSKLLLLTDSSQAWQGSHSTMPSEKSGADPSSAHGFLCRRDPVSPVVPIPPNRYSSRP